MFIEPKAQFLQKAEPWKLDFLSEIKIKFENKIITFEGQGYRLIGAPFYDSANETKFLKI